MAYYTIGTYVNYKMLSNIHNTIKQAIPTDTKD